MGVEQQEEQLPNPLLRLVEEVLDPLQRFHRREASRSSLKGRDLIDQLCLLRTTSLISALVQRNRGRTCRHRFLRFG